MFYAIGYDGSIAGFRDLHPFSEDLTCYRPINASGVHIPRVAHAVRPSNQDIQLEGDRLVYVAVAWGRKTRALKMTLEDAERHMDDEESYSGEEEGTRLAVFLTHLEARACLTRWRRIWGVE